MMVICSFLFWSWGSKSLNEGKTLDVGLFSDSASNREYDDNGTVTIGDDDNVLDPTDGKDEEPDNEVDED